MGDNIRVMSFPTSTATADNEALTLAIKTTSSDVLLPGQTFFLQMKRGGGIFVDLLEMGLPDKLVIKAVARKPEVCIHVLLYIIETTRGNQESTNEI